MQRFWVITWMMFWVIAGVVCFGNGEGAFANAGPLQERLDRFPDWQSQPVLQSARGDLYYPNWLAGQWTVTSTLVDLAAPLAPEITTPGFAASQKTLQQPITFPVRFAPEPNQFAMTSPFPSWGAILPISTQKIVADRADNGMSLAQVSLGAGVLQSVKIDPRSPNRQVSQFKNGQLLVTKIRSRGVETGSDTNFVSSELYQQEFRSSTQIYFNQVENTIAYHQVSPSHLEADQVTAIYLSPQDPSYFKAKNQPVALYRYHLDFALLAKSVS